MLEVVNRRKAHSMRFEVKLGDQVIGFSDLEGGDPPMGVAFGRFLPTSAYASIQPHCITHRESWTPIPELKVALPGGLPIECSGGIQIIDLSRELGEKEIEIHLNGATKPPYGVLFLNHVDAHKKQFGR